MPSVEATRLQLSGMRHTDPVYATARTASAGIVDLGSTGWVGQARSSSPVESTIYRSAFWYELSDIPENANITGVTFKVYGRTSAPDDDFIIYMVEANCGYPLTSTDYSKLESTDLGQLDTSIWDTGGWNTFTFNAAGLVVINAALQAGRFCIGLRSEEEINASEPTLDNIEFVRFYCFTGTNPPVLTITWSEWPDSYPTVPSFPVSSKLDLNTYGVISTYLTALDRDLLVLIDSDGNIDLAVANWITWTGTSEKIAYDNANSRVTFTTLESTTVLTLSGDLVCDDLTADTTSAVDGDIGNNMVTGSTAYTNIKAKLADNEIVFSARVAYTPANLDGGLYMDSTSGDFVLRTRDDGQAGTKTDILGDFSAM